MLLFVNFLFISAVISLSLYYSPPPPPHTPVLLFLDKKRRKKNTPHWNCWLFRICFFIIQKEEKIEKSNFEHVHTRAQINIVWLDFAFVQSE